MRQFTAVDNLLKHIDLTLRTVFPPEKRSSRREIPGLSLQESTLSISERKHISGLIRVNHAGEVSAQALYQGQAMTARLTHTRKQMEACAEEEIDHLAWCENRLMELGGRTSHLNPFWYFGALCIGAFAGLMGDNLSLGFVAETENQVVSHLRGHLDRLPAQDLKTRVLFEQMLKDEAMHASTAKEAGAVELPFLIRKLMQLTSKIMTKTAYYF